MKTLVKNELVEVIPIKNVKKLSLTQKGEQVTKTLLSLKSELNSIQPTK